MLEFVNFSLKFREKGNLITVVKNLNFKIERGERFALVGESGSGKSVTAMSILSKERFTGIISIYCLKTLILVLSGVKEYP